MLLSWTWFLFLFPLILLVSSLLIYTAWMYVCYVPTIARIFDETPIFHPPQESPDENAQEVRLETADGLQLYGSWLRTTAPACCGTFVFCHEFLSDRWSYRLYCEQLREYGFDMFTFDFRNHGKSEFQPHYRSSQWVSDSEVIDVRAVIKYVMNQLSDDVPLYLLGISRGAGAAILASSVELRVQAVVTDGAFATQLTQLAYMKRWVGIYLDYPWLTNSIPDWYYGLLGWFARCRVSRKNKCRYPNVERAIRKLSPRPLLMIHGEKDSYIVPDLARELFSFAGEPKQLWIVPGAKHNCAARIAGATYVQRLLQFVNTSSKGLPQAKAGTATTL